jgi:uncharacterized protein YcbK (DUF882 family)
MAHSLDQEFKLSPHFKRKEFACKCGCGFSLPDAELLSVLEDVREHFGKPVNINSACRCPDHNKAVGGAPNSAHVQGIAADIDVKDVSPADVQQYVLNKYQDRYGIGTYNTFTHIDVRAAKARW